MDPLNILTSRLTDMAAAFVKQLPAIGIAIVLLLVTWAAVRLADRLLQKLLRKGNMRQTLAAAYRKIIGITLWAIGIVIAAGIVFPSITPGKLLTVLGLGSVAIGFAFKDIFENFIAGLLILVREPFGMDDFIECEGDEGFVEEITVRDTRIRTVDGQAIVIPNAHLFKNPVTVRTARDRRRVTVICGVAYDEDIDRCREVITETVQKLKSVDDAKDVQVFAQEFADSSVNFEVTWWTGSSPVEIRRSRDEVIAAVKRALDEAGIEIPFPYRTLTFKDAVPVADSVADAA